MRARRREKVIKVLGSLVVFAAFSSVAETQATTFYNVSGNIWVAVAESSGYTDWTWAKRDGYTDQSHVEGVWLKSSPW